jgi:Tfp pilus assembly protein PilN
MSLTGLISGTMDAEESFKSMTLTATMMFMTNLIPAIQQVTTAIKAGQSAMIALGASTAAATAGISAALILIGLVGAAVAKQIKFIEENSPENQLKRINALLEKQQELIAEANSKAKEARKAHENVQELKKRYEELRDRIVLTEEEQEEYNKIIE